MGDVIQFPNPVVELFSCSECGDNKFFLHASGIIQCSNCENYTGRAEDFLEEVLKNEGDS